MRDMTDGWLIPLSINSYLSCPRRFYLRYIKEPEARPNIQPVRGSAVHKTLERFFTEQTHSYAYYGETRNAIPAIFNDEWRARKDQLLDLKLKDQDIAFYYQDSKKD